MSIMCLACVYKSIWPCTMNAPQYPCMLAHSASSTPRRKRYTSIHVLVNLSFHDLRSFPPPSFLLFPPSPTLSHPFPLSRHTPCSSSSLLPLSRAHTFPPKSHLLQRWNTFCTLRATSRYPRAHKLQLLLSLSYAPSFISATTLSLSLVCPFIHFSSPALLSRTPYAL